MMLLGFSIGIQALSYQDNPRGFSDKQDGLPGIIVLCLCGHNGVDKMEQKQKWKTTDHAVKIAYDHKKFPLKISSLLQ